MTDRRLSRFEHLERARPTAPGAAPEPSGASSGRIAAVEPSHAGARPPAALPTGASLPRFDPEPEPTLELADTGARRPFTRCARCGTDSNAFLTACQGCGAPLDSAAQRAFDARFWAERDAQAAAEARAEQALEAGRDRARAEEAAARQAMGEALAREVGDAERRRLDWSVGGARLGGAYDPTPLGLRLLRALPDARWRWGVAAGLAAVLGGLVLHGALSQPHRATLPIGLALLVLLAVPGGRRGRWGRW
jgi:hypothetical protein